MHYVKEEALAQDSALSFKEDRGEPLAPDLNAYMDHRSM